MVDYHMTANSLLLKLQSLKQGRIPDLLITDQVLQKGVQQLLKAVHREVPYAHVIGNTETWREQGYWQCHNNTLFLQIGVYFSYMKDPYQLYQAVTFPIPLHSDEIGDKGYTQIKLKDNQMIWVSPTEGRYI